MHRWTSQELVRLVQRMCALRNHSPLETHDVVAEMVAGRASVHHCSFQDCFQSHTYPPRVLGYLHSLFQKFEELLSTLPQEMPGSATGSACSAGVVDIDEKEGLAILYIVDLGFRVEGVGIVKSYMGVSENRGP